MKVYLTVTEYFHLTRILRDRNLILYNLLSPEKVIMSSSSSSSKSVYRGFLKNLFDAEVSITELSDDIYQYQINVDNNIYFHNKKIDHVIFLGQGLYFDNCDISNTKINCDYIYHNNCKLYNIIMDFKIFDMEPTSDKIIKMKKNEDIIPDCIKISVIQDKK